MEKNEFTKLENMCRLNFSEVGSCFHVCSQENHPILFHNEDEFKAAMNIVALCALLIPELQIFTFEIMGNHFHFALSGPREKIENFLNVLISRLASHPNLSTSSADIKKLAFKIYPIEDIDNLRNVIAYINRNGAVVNYNESVYTYRWGANRFFFNPEAESRFSICGKKTSFRERRNIFHSDMLSKETPHIIVLDGYVSPLCYCRISKAESFFRNTRHYFFSISRNIEASKEIAQNIGEQIFYTDDDLFVLLKAVCTKKYNCDSIAHLPKEAKIELAKELHFEYNAGNKQISRLLKIELQVVSSLFPK